jgi:hypothetical protein
MATFWTDQFSAPSITAPKFQIAGIHFPYILIPLLIYRVPPLPITNKKREKTKANEIQKKFKRHIRAKQHSFLS